jgi:hypothetical protein
MSVILPAAEVPGAAQESTSQDILTAVDGVETGLALLATEATATGIANALTTLATEATATGIAATVTKLRKWPYETHAKIEPSSDATNDYYTYKTALDVTVGTITINKTTGLITYSPDKVV